MPVMGMVKITAAICLYARLAAVFTFLYVLLHSPERERLTPVYIGKTGLEGQHNFPKVTLVGGGRDKIQTQSCLTPNSLF